MIDQQELYLELCPACKRQTPCRVFRISVKSGIKLQCLICSLINKKRFKVAELHTYHEPTQPGEPA